ncbi:SagB/ThcOx family dehydrogenase [Actinocatenispora thailandica]|nr:SagB family peptide dehydrogenase [Actinocatenispora thailandica]
MRERFRLRRDVTLAGDDAEYLGLRLGDYEIALAGCDLASRALLLRLANGWVDAESLHRLPGGAGSQPLRARALLLRLLALSLLDRRAELPGRPLLEVLPHAARVGAERRSGQPSVPASCRLSRFVVLRPDAAGLVARSPLSATAIRCLDPQLVRLLCAAATGEHTPAELAEQLDVDTDSARSIVAELAAARILVSAGVHTTEHHAQPYLFWSVEELQLHDRSRPGRHALPLGGTRRFEGRVAPAPLASHRPCIRTVELTPPDPGAVTGGDATLSDLLAARRSIREHDPAHPISLAQLGEFLYRVQRTRSAGVRYGQELGARPYPSGGGICELEVYPAVWRCDGLAPGLYHYDGLAHRLELLGDEAGRLSAILDYARASLGAGELPQVLLVVTARVARLLWRYEGMGYAMTLKHAGVLTELMYLVATAMRLAPCAVGGGDSVAFAQLSGLDPIEEPSIAEFALGSVGAR